MKIADVDDLMFGASIKNKVDGNQDILHQNPLMTIIINLTL